MPPGKKYNFTVETSQQVLRVDRFLSLQLPDHSRSFYQKLIQQGRVTVNGAPVKPSYQLAAGERVVLEIPPPEVTELQAEAIPLPIVFEDEHLLVIDKPAGMVVHPGAGIHSGTLVNALMHHCRDLSGVGGRLRPGIVHRLDKNTSGLLVVAKNDRAHLQLQRQFADKTARREYKALVWGTVTPAEGMLETHLNRSKSDRKKFAVAEQGKPAITHYRVEAYFDFLTLLQVWLKTGRTHQIRVHFSYLHHPVFGDPEYSGRKKQINRLSALSEKNFALYLLKFLNRQALHAFQLAFQHPVSGEEMAFSAPLPHDFKGVLEKLNHIERD